jgi:sporulation protein YlmC with PRC-barrel domain
MRLAAFLGKSVLDRSGRDLGAIHDVRLVQDGPVIGSFGASYRVHTLIAGTPSIGVRLGLHREELKGSWPLKALFERVHAGIFTVRWSEIRSIEEDVVRLRSMVQGGERELGLDQDPAVGHFLDAGFQLLDRQIVDVNGRMAGKVDDLELVFSDEPRTPPHVVAVVSGPSALSRRIGGRLGSWIDAVYGRLAEEPDPAEISFGVVKRIDNHVELAVSREDLGIMTLEDWVRTRVISKIPGS